jgi:hypothetical protein
MIIDKRTLAKFGYREKCFFFGFFGKPHYIVATHKSFLFYMIIKIAKHKGSNTKRSHYFYSFTFCLFL